MGISQTTFESEREANQYAFGQTDFEAIDVDYMLDFCVEITDSSWSKFNERQENQKYNFLQLAQIFHILERSDVNNQNPFKKDSVLYPILDQYASASTREVPLFIFDLEVHELNETNKELVAGWESNSPFPSFSETEILEKEIYGTGLLGDSLHYAKINVYWNDETFISNTQRTIDSLYLHVGKNKIHTPKDQVIDISDAVGFGVDKVKVEIVFSDSTKKMTEFTCSLKIEKEDKSLNKSFSFFSDDFYIVHGQNNLELQYKIAYGCGPPDEAEELNKPHIIVAGWGPYTEKDFVNNNQDWPFSFSDLYTKFNQEDYIDNLINAGFDVILAKFVPPNEDARINADALKKLINEVNSQKNAVGSFEENIIQGFSAGAIASRLALLEMEKDHLQNGAPHHHTKLYISFEGEHQGANIPLGAQQMVEYLHDNFPSGLFAQWSIYTLNYILNATLSHQMLRYSYTKTGSSANPGQGAHYWRGQLLNDYNLANHSKNSNNLGYPAFSRNISISNGMNESDYDASNNANHYPYDDEAGKLFYKDYRLTKRAFIKFIQPGTNSVFKIEKLNWFQWKVIINKVTKDPLVLDNAPGGMFPLGSQYVFRTIINKFENSFSSGLAADLARKEAMFAFTPTFSTHDLQINYIGDATFNPYSTNGYPKYSFKEAGLMYTNKTDANADNVNNASNTHGYPHLNYPNQHYQITPFDAIYTWSKNTEHNTGAEKQQNAVLAKPSPGQAKIKNFMMGETDYYFTYVQDRKFGWNARSNYDYKASFRSPKTIFIGDDVTQRAEFNTVILEDNSDILFAAEEEVVVDDIHIKSGAECHIKIEPYYCQSITNMDVGAPNGGFASSESTFKQSDNRAATIDGDKGKKLFENEGNSINVYPNPGSGATRVYLNKNVDGKTNYKVFNISGKKIQDGFIIGNQHELSLPNGMYFIKVKTGQLWKSKKFVIQ